MLDIDFIKKLRDETNCSLNDAKIALTICENFEVSKEFLNVYNQAVVRYKIVDGQKIPFEIKDYVLLVKNIVNKK